MTDDAPLPDLLERVEEALGHAAMLKLAHAFGGQRINIPNKVRPSSRWAKHLGVELAQQIADLIGGDTDITVPLGPMAHGARARRRVRTLLGEGKSTNEVVREVGLHEVTVRRLRRRMRDSDAGGTDGRQSDLFPKAK